MTLADIAEAAYWHEQDRAEAAAQAAEHEEHLRAVGACSDYCVDTSTEIRAMKGE